MLFAIDFDGTIVRSDNRAFDDTTTPLEFLPGARAALLALKRAGHTLLLYSARSNRASLFTPAWDPLVRAGKRRVSPARHAAAKPIHWARYQQMLRFVEEQLPGVFDAIDDGLQGKPLADLFIDDRTLTYGLGPDGKSWSAIASTYGVPPPSLFRRLSHG